MFYLTYDIVYDDMLTRCRTSVLRYRSSTYNVDIIYGSTLRYLTSMLSISHVRHFACNVAHDIVCPTYHVVPTDVRHRRRQASRCCTTLSTRYASSRRMVRASPLALKTLRSALLGRCAESSLNNLDQPGPIWI